MDPLTHYMFAYTLGRKWNLERSQLKALTFAALLPDIDVISIFLGIEFAIGFHGTIMHSIVVALMLSLILSIVFFLVYKKNVAHYTLVGISMHLSFDFITTLLPRWTHEGMVLFFPFSTNEFALRGIVPYSFLIGVVYESLLIFFSLYALLFFIRNNVYPWRLWFDERKILGISNGTH